MRRFLNVTAIVLVISIALSLSACVTKPELTTAQPTQTTTPPTTAAPTTEPQNEGLTLYKAARETLENQENVGLVISVTETMSLPAEQLVTNIQQEVSYLGLGTENFKSVVNDTSGTSSGTMHNKETFVGGKVYIRASEQYFLSELTAEEYIARYLPIVLIDENLYSTIDYIPGDYNSEVRFSGLSEPESWFPADAEVLEASGTAVLSAEGTLKKYTYDVTFRVLGATVRQEVRIVVDKPKVTQIEEPYNVSDYLAIPHPDILKIADLAYSLAMSSTSISCSVIDEIACDAGSIKLVDTAEIQTWDNGDYMAQVNFVREYIDLQTMETSYYTQLDTYRDNVYSVSANGGSPENSYGIDKQAMQSYVYEEIIWGWIGYGYMTECAATNLGNILLIEFKGSEELAKSLEDGISNFLFEDEAYLDDIASKYETIQIDFYLAIDTYLGLPTAAGFTYCGSHTIDGNEYVTSRTVSSSIYLASNESHKAITGEPMPDTDDSESPAPLFYHVTGDNGEEMWLLGTIHVGDERTGNLPQQIMDAFSASDALALECDPSAMEEESKDPAVAEQYASAYYYNDGTTAADHIANTEIYTYGLALMKATGYYNYILPHLKVPMWESTISGEWLKRSYTLSSDKGVDNRLLQLAESQNKPVLQIESNLFQLKMMTGWSDPLAENLLGSTLSYDLKVYAGEIRDLYEAWCRGDEAALTAYFKIDTSELTAEQKVLMEEYRKAMETDRNKHMAETAIEYLESGDTVFYAVGLAHVIAEDGLVSALRDAGYTVEPITYE